MRAAVTSFCTFLAMRLFMFAAFIAAGLANVCAQRTNCFGVNAAPRHRGCSHCAHLGAFHVEFNAFRHHRNVGFMKTGSGAVVAGYGARVAGFDAGVVWMLGHWDAFKKVGWAAFT